ncbi:SDR family oxidoreductase [Marihabitans asiaticum]|uniref:Glucose 1-dehydrogenase n=1 Tax=Marihabitans asiaticum TaxID=415218 RepID=A0A560WA89_9MICO|nr:SDR family oxidoreductase [Marihabitans asiaticum]TWD14546.1 glucose 1-dehydrogenase [Marihabitans asiaticum]
MSESLGPLQDKVVVVTGGSSGIGEGIVREASAQGARVIIDYVSDAEHAQAMVAELGGPERAIAVEADVSSVADLTRLKDEAVAAFGRIDVWVNNAGVEFSQQLLTLTEDKYDLQMAINLKGAVFGSKIAAEQLIAQGGGGVIVNTSSTHEEWPMPSDLTYCVSKGGMKMLTRTAGVELGEHGIRVVNVAPGAIRTPINADDDAADQAALRAAIPLGYIGSPEEMGKVTCFVASDAASYITATTIFADGGLMQQPGAV